jgi:hypothetical protein
MQKDSAYNVNDLSNNHHENELETINKMVGENKMKIINNIDEPNKRIINEEKSNKQIEGLKNVMPEVDLKKNKIIIVEPKEKIIEPSFEDLENVMDEIENLSCDRKPSNANTNVKSKSKVNNKNSG